MSSSRLDEVENAMSRVTSRFSTSRASDWFIVCMPNCSWPACIVP